MAYYAALTSIKETTDQIMGRIMDLSKTSTLPEFLPRVHVLYQEVSESLVFFSSLKPSSSSRKRILELTLMDRVHNKVNSLRDFMSSSRAEKAQANYVSRGLYASEEEEIKEAVYKMEDVLESHMSSRLLPHSHTDKIREAFEQVEQEIDSFITKITKIKGKCLEMSSSVEPATPDEQAVVVSSAYSSSRIDFFDENNSVELVGLLDELVELKRRLLSEDERELMIISIIGMAGIGKTALVKSICKDPDVWCGFHYHLFVPVGPNYLLKGVLLSILAQLIPKNSNDYSTLMNRDENKIAKRVKKELNHKSYIIILDDVWNEDVWIDLKRIVPDNSNGSRVLLTTRLVHVARQVVQVTEEDSRYHNVPHKKRFLDKDESWELLRKKVFHTEHRCPYKLQESGKRIAKKCEGLPLAIISVGNHLAKAEKTVEYWESVAEKGIASIIGADEALLKVLHPSYEHLPAFMKPLFLYLGVFPQYYEIVASKLIKLWIAEGLVTRNVNAEEAVDACLILIRDNGLVIAKQHMFTGKIKTCSLHIVYWVYCKTQARKEKLFHILQTLDDCLVEDITSQRRLCIHNNSLFGVKDAYDSMESVSNARSLLCTGPYHKYPVPICLRLEWLRVFEAVSIRFFEFPEEVLKLTLLRYIAITYDGDIPPSISQLINLWYLIVHRHYRIISSESPSYLPKEIWDMKELLHLQVVGSDLPEPPEGASLGNLLKLLGVSPLSCTKQILESIPNLKKLGVQIVLPDDPKEPLRSLDHLRHLDHKLESLKCDVINPKPSSLVAARAYPTSVFPKGLKKLSLSGFGYLWDQISKINSSSPNLKKLKLRHCAFQGSSWEVDHEFPVLQFLLLEDIDLRYWNVDSDSLAVIEHLIIRHCYKLEDIPSKIRDILHAIEIVDCKPAVADSANVLEGRYSKFVPFIDVSVVSSWDD